MKNFNLKKTFLSSLMFLSILSCYNVFAMKSVPNFFRTQYVEDTNIQKNKVQKASNVFAESIVEALLRLPSSVLNWNIRSYLIENKVNFKKGFARILSEILLEQHPSVLIDLSNSDPEVSAVLASNFAEEIFPSLCEVVQAECPDMQILDDINQDAFRIKFKNLIKESFKQISQSSWNFKSLMQKTSAGTKFTARATALTGMLVGLFIVYEAYSLINKGYYKEGLAIITFIGLVYVVLSKTQHVFNGAVRPLVRQGQQVYNDGHALLYGQERRPEIEEVLRRIAREEADEKR